MDKPVAAFFDVDGTLLKGNIIRYYAYMRRREMGPAASRLWTLGFLLRVPYYWSVDQVSRTRLARGFYRNYRNFSVDRLREGAQALFEEELKPRFFPAALECVSAHRQAGHQIVLVSGSICQIVEPIARHVGADHHFCVALEERDGGFTGGLVEGPLAGSRKAEVLAGFARDHGIEMASSHAYADSFDDVPMLSQVGHPVVVNPKGRLEKLARSQGWSIRHWAPGAS